LEIGQTAQFVQCGHDDRYCRKCRDLLVEFGDAIVAWANDAPDSPNLNDVADKWSAMRRKRVVG
jgi:hypothetical protein